MKKVFLIVLLLFSVITISNIHALSNKNYELEFVDSSHFDLKTGVYKNEVGWITSVRTNIIGGSLNFNNFNNFHIIQFWNKNNSYIGFYSTVNNEYISNNSDKYLGAINSNSFNIPTGSTKFAISANYLNGYTPLPYPNENLLYTDLFLDSPRYTKDNLNMITDPTFEDGGYWNMDVSSLNIDNGTLDFWTKDKYNESVYTIIDNISNRYYIEYDYYSVIQDKRNIVLGNGVKDTYINNQYINNTWLDNHYEYSYPGIPHHNGIFYHQLDSIFDVGVGLNIDGTTPMTVQGSMPSTFTKGIWYVNGYIYDDEQLIYAITPNTTDIYYVIDGDNYVGQYLKWNGYNFYVFNYTGNPKLIISSFPDFDTYGITLPNGIKDTYLSNGRVEKKVGRLVLNGSEDWTYSGTSKYFRLMLNPDPINLPVNDNVRTDVISNLYENGEYGDFLSSATEPRFTYNSTNIPTPYFYIKDTRFTDIASFKAFLGTNNLMIYYQLATPTILNNNSAIISNEPILEATVYREAYPYERRTLYIQDLMTNEKLPLLVNEWQRYLGTTNSTASPFKYGLGTSSNELGYSVSYRNPLLYDYNYFIDNFSSDNGRPFSQLSEVERKLQMRTWIDRDFEWVYQLEQLNFSVNLNTLLDYYTTYLMLADWDIIPVEDFTINNAYYSYESSSDDGRPLNIVIDDWLVDIGVFSGRNLSSDDWIRILIPILIIVVITIIMAIVKVKFMIILIADMFIFIFFALLEKPNSGGWIPLWLILLVSLIMTIIIIITVKGGSKSE